jgi:hypothetical protein
MTAEFGDLNTILSAKCVDLSTMQQHGLINPLLNLMLAADKVSTPCPASQRHTQLCNEALTELYSKLNSYPLLDDIRKTLTSPEVSHDFTYHQMLVAIKASTVHVGSEESRPTLTTLLQGPLRDKLLSFINQCCTSKKDTNIKLCTQHPHMLAMIPKTLALFSSYSARSSEHTEKLGASQFTEILKHHKIDAADFVQTELWLQMIVTLNLEAEHQHVNSDGILDMMSKHSKDNLYNELSIKQGDNQQCLRLLKLTLSREIGVGKDAFKSAFVQADSRTKLLAYVQDNCIAFNLSDSFMSDNHLKVWHSLNWYVNSGVHTKKTSFVIVKEYYQGLKQTFLDQANLVQEELKRAERLQKSAEKQKAFRCYIKDCKANIPFGKHFCDPCFDAGLVKCSVCSKVLASETEFQSRMCMDCISLSSLSDESDSLTKKCLICNSQFQPEMGPDSPEICKACFEAFSDS